MNILIIFPDENVRNSLSFAVEGRTGAKTQSFDNALDTYRLLADYQSSIDLAICDHPQNSAQFFAMLKTLKRPVPTIVCPLQASKVEDAFVDDNIIGIFRLERLTDDLLPLMDDFMSSREKPLYGDAYFTRIKTDLLLQIGTLPCDIYIKLSDKKFLKFYRYDDVFEISDHQRVKFQKKIEYLYVKKEDTNAIVSRLKDDILRSLDPKKITLAQAHTTVKKVFATVHQFLAKAGPTPAIQQLVNATIAANLRSQGTRPGLKQALSYLEYDRERYVASHSLCLAQVGCVMAAHLGWNSLPTFKKIQFAAFFHDISMENQELARIQTLDELTAKQSRFLPEEIHAYKLHPVHAAHLSVKFDEVPSDTEIIIRQHHEAPDGTGFPHSLHPNQMHPLACVFILSHELVQHIYDRNGGIDYQAFVMQMRAKYDFPSFRPLLKKLDGVQF